MWQAQWEYFDSTGYEPYPDEINAIIENAYQDKKPYAEWEEKSARYRLTFETMEEEMANDASSKVKVRRNTKGELFTYCSYVLEQFLVYIQLSIRHQDSVKLEAPQ